MKRRLLILVTAITLLFLANAAFAELELGFALTPPITTDVPENIAGDFLESSIKSLHVGFSWWWLFYASWDSLILPPYVVQELAATKGGEGDNIFYTPGPLVPGYLNLFDLGIRPKIGPILAFAEVGINHMWIYGDSWDVNPYRSDANTSVGVNMRIGAGLAFGWWGITASGTLVFTDFETMAEDLDTLSNGSQFAQDQVAEKLINSLIPSVGFNIYF
jgi:hypothetical protein